MCERYEVAKITHEAFCEKQTIEFSAETDIHHYIDQIERLLVAAGFSSESVEQAIVEKANAILHEGSYE